MPSIEEFVKQYESKKTQATYYSLLQSFFRESDVTEKEFFKEETDQILLLRRFLKNMKKRPSKSVHAMCSVLRSFYRYAGLEVSGDIWETATARKRAPRAVSRVAIPTNEELKLILSYGETKAKALFLLLASSGLRLEDAVRIRLEDLQFEESPPRMILYEDESYLVGKRTVFCSEEAKDATLVWLRERQQYLRASNARNNVNKIRKDLDDPRVFPFSTNVARAMWTRLLRKAGLDQKDATTKRYLLKVGSLRSFYETRMRLSVPGEVVDALLGKKGTMEEAFKKYGQKRLQELYLRAGKDLAVFEIPTDDVYIKRLERELKARDERLRQLEEQVKSHDEFFEGIDALAMEKLGMQFADTVLSEEGVDPFEEYRKRFEKRRD